MTARSAALFEAVAIRPGRHAVGLLTGTLEMLDDIAGMDRTGDARIEADALRGLIDMNARIGLALALGDANCDATMRGE